MVSPSSDQRTSIVTVSYRSASKLSEMLKSVPTSIPVFVVNNAPDEKDDLQNLCARHSQVSLIENTKNIGFGAACNLGARATRTEFILFLNPDTKLKEGCIEALELSADTYTQAVAFNPAMSNALGKPIFKRSSVLLPRHMHLGRGWPNESRKVNVLNGAALFVRKEAFDLVGGFDENIFLYHEDDDLSIRLSKDIGELMFIREAEVTHLSGHSTARNAEIAALKAKHMGWSRVYATRKHGIKFSGYHAVISALSQILNPALVFSKRKRAKQFAFVNGVLSALRDEAAR